MTSVLPPVSVLAVQPGSSGSPSPSAGAAKTHAAAKKFEAMFMGEMMRLARPQNQAAGVFSEGQAEKTWSVLMDQALGQAAAQGNTPLGAEIEQAMQKAQTIPGKGSN